MKLKEFEGKQLFERYGISVPKGVLLDHPQHLLDGLSGEVVLKAQVASGDRKKHGGIQFSRTSDLFNGPLGSMFQREVQGETVSKVLIEEKIDIEKEWYLSISYCTDRRAPVLAFSKDGGSGIDSAGLVPISFAEGVTTSLIDQVTEGTHISPQDASALGVVATNLWRLFLEEHATLAEINPLVKTRAGVWIAADSKVILDDEKHVVAKRPFLSLGGDIAILASGGGASMLNIDSLMEHGGRPANYVEYSGNPPADVVRDLTVKVLSQEGIKGCWVIGGTANFTDIYETMGGFVEGLRALPEKPNFPIVIRRDGPRQQEAFEMLKQVGKEEGFQLYMFDSETPMEESARMMVKLAYT